MTEAVSAVRGWLAGEGPAGAAATVVHVPELSGPGFDTVAVIDPRTGPASRRYVLVAGGEVWGTGPGSLRRLLDRAPDIPPAQLARLYGRIAAPAELTVIEEPDHFALQDRAFEPPTAHTAADGSRTLRFLAYDQWLDTRAWQVTITPAGDIRAERA